MRPADSSIASHSVANLPARGVEPALAALKARFPTLSAALWRVAELEEELGRGREPAMRLFGMRPAPSSIVTIIATHGRISHERIATIYYGGETPIANPPQMIKSVVCAARKALKPWGIEIITEHGFGYAMAPEHARKVLALAKAMKS